MGELGIDKLILIFVVVLLLFGAKRLPELSASLGKGIRELRRGLTDVSTSDATPGAEANPPSESGRQDADITAPRARHGGEPKRLPNGGHAP